jgi:uncharacterized protein (TIGR03790 family)
MTRLAGVVTLAASLAVSFAQTGENVLVVVNQSSEVSRRIGQYYASRRSIPAANMCRLNASVNETIDWGAYEREIEQPIAACLKNAHLTEKILYIAMTLGTPLRVTGNGAGLGTENCAVDSELALLYSKMHGAQFARMGVIKNPYFSRIDQPFRHPDIPLYLVTRLAGYDFDDVKAEIDRALGARNEGKFVIDLTSSQYVDGNNWLREAADRLPKDRVVLDESPAVLYNQTDVIGYASWGSNDGNRKRRHLGFRWLPGAVATEYVSTDARTFQRPPENWIFTNWHDRDHWFGGSPQGLTADYIHDGATAATGHVFEPYLSTCPRPNYLLPAYCSGRTLAESYYLSLPVLSWQNVMVGDPLCQLGKPDKSGHPIR